MFDGPDATNLSSRYASEDARRDEMITAGCRHSMAFAAS
jgi:hypothetical protein